ncbi:MAG: phosphohydrolase [Kiritimatiellia bacterium]|jgi:metal-dependent HD superfamily phosphatase/phosphodiesterase
MISPKESALDRKIAASIPRDSPCHALMLALFADQELHAMQEHANTVSIRRLGYNDHGPVHMRLVTYNAIRMLELLRKAGIKTSLETEGAGNYDDSLCAVFLAAFLHDVGMMIGRDGHEVFATWLTLPIIDRALEKSIPDDLQRRVVIRATALEGIVGHMGTRHIDSLEAGVILVADGCDMTQGRARIPMILNTTPKIGDIHKYSANSIKRVGIRAGAEKPILIDVEMSGEVGFFQIEEVLISKIDSSPAKQHVELYAGVTGEPRKRYL